VKKTKRSATFKQLNITCDVIFKLILNRFSANEAKHCATTGLFIDKMETDAAVAIIEMLITEMNSKFMTDLGDVCGDVNSDSELPDKYADLRFIFVGGSHPDRMAAAADRLGIEHVNLRMPGFRVKDETIKTAVCLRKNTHRNVVVYQLLDNKVFFESREDGSRALPSKGPDDNCYHIKGKLEYADHGVCRDTGFEMTRF
jgi:hypothetical protein